MDRVADLASCPIRHPTKVSSEGIRAFGQHLIFQTATRALHAMNGATLGSKQIVVRLHEPKQLRKEKLAQRYAAGGHGHNGHPRSGSGATSPTLSEAGDGSVYGGWSSPVMSGRDRNRRGSGSYYQVCYFFYVTLAFRANRS